MCRRALGDDAASEEGVPQDHEKDYHHQDCDDAEGSEPECTRVFVVVFLAQLEWARLSSFLSASGLFNSRKSLYL